MLPVRPQLIARRSVARSCTTRAHLFEVRLFDLVHDRRDPCHVFVALPLHNLCRPGTNSCHCTTCAALRTLRLPVPPPLIYQIGVQPCMCTVHRRQCALAVRARRTWSAAQRCAFVRYTQIQMSFPPAAGRCQYTSMAVPVGHSLGGTCERPHGLACAPCQVILGCGTARRCVAVRSVPQCAACLRSFATPALTDSNFVLSNYSGVAVLRNPPAAGQAVPPLPAQPHPAAVPRQVLPRDTALPRHFSAPSYRQPARVSAAVLW